MALQLDSAVDAILTTFKVAWDANTPALNGGAAPAVVYEATEEDLKPHPRVGTAPWARAVIRHGDARKVTLNSNGDRLARYRREGILWVQIFTPVGSPPNWLLCQKLAMVVQTALEGNRAAGDQVVFTKSAIQDRDRDSNWFLYDVKTGFYWDELK